MLHFDGKVENKEYELITDGDYEVTLEAEWAKTKSGDQYINCKFTIRKDVDQKFGGRIIFDGIYKNKTTGEYNSSKINGILNAIPAAKQDFEDYDDLIQYINGQNMIISIVTQEAQGDYSAKSVVDYLSYRMSENIPQGTKDTTSEEVDVDSLPF